MRVPPKLVWMVFGVGLLACATTPSTDTSTTSSGGMTSALSTTVGFEIGVGGGCGLGGASIAGAGCEGVDGGVMFATDVLPIFQGCTGEICHGAFTWKTTVGAPSAECCDPRVLIAPGDANHSYLLDKVHGHHLCGGEPMPLGGPPLSASDSDVLLRWVCEGAPNN